MGRVICLFFEQYIKIFKYFILRKYLNISQQNYVKIFYTFYKKTVDIYHNMVYTKGTINQTEVLKMRVENIEKNGKKVANQFVITDGNKICFQSYNSMIATVDREAKKIVLGVNWDYSNTTTRHRNYFFEYYVGLDCLATTKGILEALKNGLCNGWTIALE